MQNSHYDNASNFPAENTVNVFTHSITANKLQYSTTSTQRNNNYDKINVTGTWQL